MRLKEQDRERMDETMRMVENEVLTSGFFANFPCDEDREMSTTAKIEHA